VNVLPSPPVRCHRSSRFCRQGFILSQGTSPPPIYRARPRVPRYICALQAA
jgi:hypothetical protein